MDWKHAAAQEPLVVEGAYNVRDLGGYPTASGGHTRRGAFLRSDGLSALTDAGKRALLDLGVGCVVDLRTEEEAARQPEKLTAADGVDLYQVPLADGVASNGFQGLPARMGEMYVGLLEHSGEKFAEIFRIFGSHPDCAVLFHCSAGKDRTGVTAMLLLSLAGAPRPVIVADYSASYGNLGPLFEKQKALLRETGIHIPEHVMRSDPSEIELAMDWIEEHYGTAEAYLLHTGVPAGTLAELKARLTE